MGYEYRVFFGAKPPPREEIVTILRAAPHFSRCDESQRFFRYDATPREEREMPDAHVEIEKDGSIYVCDNGGKGSEVVDFVEAKLREHDPGVDFSELD